MLPTRRTGERSRDSDEQRNASSTRMSQKPEPRFHVDLVIRAFGMDAAGHPFSQDALARNISDHGAHISGLDSPLKPGDVIGVQLGERKARCRVVWVLDGGPIEKIQAGVRTLQGQACPWQNERELQRRDGTAPILRSVPLAKNKRKFARQRVAFTIEIRDLPGVGSHGQAKTADITGCGCYVETMYPLPLKRILDVVFWLNARRVQTTAIVRTCDRGVGMGIQFIGLDESTQQQLQKFVETLAAESVPFARARGAF